MTDLSFQIETALVKKEELETTDDCTTVSTKINTTDSSSSDIVSIDFGGTSKDLINFTTRQILD